MAEGVESRPEEAHAPPAAAGPARGARFGHVAALDGLRGLAVALVVLYHFDPALVPAGFLGVDVFFVLSGFLITSLALGEHRDTGRLDVGAFFGRRARRLLPAAVSTVAAVVVVSVVLEPPSARSGLRGQAVASLLYGANWWSIAQGNPYQASFGAVSPLNHFWSLAVEEQFYLLFPILVLVLAAVAARRSRRGPAGGLLVTASLAALASAVWMAVLYRPFTDPSRVYLGSDTHSQAVLVGVAAGAALHRWRDRLTSPGARRPAILAAAAGTVLLGVVALRADFTTPWLYRGGFLLVAVAVAALVVGVSTHRSPVTRLFELRWLCTLGLVSYGVYLWHWPISVFVDPARTGLDGAELFAVRIALTAVATAVSYRFIEAPFRRPVPRRARSRPLRRRPATGLAAVATALVVVWVIAHPAAAPAHAQSASEVPTTAAASPAPGAPSTAAPGTPTTARTGPVKVLWEGDSVAWTLGGGVLNFPQPAGYDSPFDPHQLLVWNQGRYPCPLLQVPTRSLGVERTISVCGNRDTTWPAAIARFHPDVVTWSGALLDALDTDVDGHWATFGSPEWDQRYLAGLEHLREMATASGATFVVLGQPDPRADASEPYEEALRPPNIWRFGHLRDLQRRFAAAHPADTRYVDLEAVICPTGTCPERTADGHELRPDGVHFSLDAARQLAPAITAALERSLAGSPQTAPAPQGPAATAPRP